MSEHSRLTFELRSHFGDIPLPRCIASLPVSFACGILAACLSCNANSKMSNLLPEEILGSSCTCITAHQAHGHLLLNGLVMHAADLPHLCRQPCADHTSYHLRTKLDKPALHSGMKFSVIRLRAVIHAYQQSIE